MKHCTLYWRFEELHPKVTARLARLGREAKPLASLNHPNTAHVYGFESSVLPDGTTAHLRAVLDFARELETRLPC